MSNVVPAPVQGALVPASGPTAMDPAAISSDRAAMDAHIRNVTTYLSGAEAVVGRGESFLPRFAREPDEDYEVRLGCAKFTNVFRDVVENLASKPFSRTVDLTEDSKRKYPEAAAFVEDVDGAGNHLHVFAGEVFFNAVAYDVDFIVVDKTPVEGATLADERRAGARVYWYRVPFSQMIAFYQEPYNGRIVTTHVRFREDRVERVNFGEQTVERVRIFDRQRLPDGSFGGASWKVMERRPSQGLAATWSVVEAGQFGIGEIPVVPVITGRRRGHSVRFFSTMGDVAHLQKKLYQDETNLEYAKLMAASPMLSAKDANPPTIKRKVTVNGFDQVIDEPAPVVVGPKTVLYGDWKYVNIDANALTVLEKSCDRLERQIREVGRQPLTSSSGNLTVVTTMFAAQKGNSAVQAWALGLKDALELCFKFTSRWMNLGESAEPEVYVWTDFSIDLESEAAPGFLDNAKSNGLISRKAYLNEGKRRNYLSSEYDAEADATQIDSERDKFPLPAEIGAAAGGEVAPGTGDGASGGSSATSRATKVDPTQNSRRS